MAGIILKVVQYFIEPKQIVYLNHFPYIELVDKIIMLSNLVYDETLLELLA